ncbi:uncharacterized protein DS421_12g358090 [Arachis hypogaea]|nr:uncharacterized protein DS421_12g358090 [Arachis hypogaea]
MKTIFLPNLKIMELQKYTQTITEIHPNDYRNTPKGLQKYTQTVTGIHPNDYRNTPKGLQKYT